MQARSRDRVAAICRGEADPVVLRQELLAELRRVLGFDTHVFVLTDPETSVGVAPLADVPAPMVPSLPDLIRLKYLTTVNRWTSLTGPVATLRAATGDDPGRSRVWRDLLGPHGVVDIASCVFRDRFGCWGFLDLWRRGGPFTAADTAYLDGVAATVTTGLRLAQARTFRVRPERPTGAGPVVLLLTDALRVVGQTPQTHAYLTTLVPPSAGQAPIPAGAYNVAAQLLAAEAGVDGNPPLARVHLAGGQWVSLRAARVDGPDRLIAVTVAETVPADRVALFARAFGLSDRETQVLAHLLTGPDTREVAGRMYLSEHTVQDHLKSIFAKTGTRSRRTLLSRAAGT